MSRLIAILLTLLVASPAEAQQRVALIMGNGAYRDVTALRNPPRDAQAIGTALRRLGFSVEVMLDAQRPQMLGAIRRLAEAATGAEAVLFYYAGHAVEIGGRNMLLPVNIAPEAAAIERDGVAYTEIEQLLAGRAGSTLIFLDACRDNPFSGQRLPDPPSAPPRGRASGTMRSIGNGLAGVATSSGMLIAFATAPGRVALDGAGTNSPFTTALLQHIGTEDLEVRQMLGRVRRTVREGTAGRQIPWDNSSMENEFYFKSTVPVPVILPPAPPPVPPVLATPPPLSDTAPAPVDTRPQQERSVTGEETARALVGNTLEYEGTRQRRVRQYFHADGRAQMTFGGDRLSGMGAMHDTGRWELTGGRFCITWNRWRAGERYCLAPRRDGAAWFLIRSDDQVRADVSIRRGDAYNIWRW